MIKPTPHFVEQKTKISIAHAGNKFKAELPWDSDLVSVLDAIVGLLIASGWSAETVQNAIIDMGEEYKKDL